MTGSRSRLLAIWLVIGVVVLAVAAAATLVWTKRDREVTGAPPNPCGILAKTDWQKIIPGTRIKVDNPSPDDSGARRACSFDPTDQARGTTLRGSIEILRPSGSNQTSLARNSMRTLCEDRSGGRGSSSLAVTGP